MNDPKRQELPPRIAMEQEALRTPRAAAIAGIAFSVLLTLSQVIIRQALPSNVREGSAWLDDPTSRNLITIALALVPFAGIAFLWFIGVVRDRVGQREDRFFATVFLGSGLLFVGMLFVGASIASGLIATFGRASGAFGDTAPSDTWRIGQAMTSVLITTYAMRMAAVFVISMATILLGSAIMPKWMGYLGYACALVLLVGAGYLAWIELLFPAWIFIVSVYLLRATFRTSQAKLTPGSGAARTSG